MDAAAFLALASNVDTASIKAALFVIFGSLASVASMVYGAKMVVSAFHR